MRIMKINKIQTVIIGLGSIGFSYEKKNRLNAVLSHAKAIKQIDKFKLLAGIDSKKNKRNLFSKEYNVDTFPNIHSCFKKFNPDLVIVSTPTKSHEEFLTQLIKYKFIKIIVCEKPFTGDYNKAKLIYKKYQNLPIDLHVNFLRRYNKALIKLRQNIIKNKFGKFYKGTVFYNKGIRENGSHFIDLMNSFFGNCKGIKIIKNGRRWTNNDYEVEFIIYYKDISINFIPLNNNFYTYGNFKIFSNSHMIEYNDDEDIKIYKNKKNPIYKNEKKLFLNETYSYIKNQSILFLYDYLVKIYYYNQKNNMVPDTTLETLKILKRLEINDKI